MASYDDLNDKRIFAVGILSVIVVAVSALAVQVLYYWMVRLQEESTASMSSYSRQDRILDKQTAEIENFGVDPESANITIPIKDAVKKVVDERQKSETNNQSSNDEA